MGLTRRGFLAAGAISGLRLPAALTRAPQAYFGLHPFIESNPKAVFIRRTRVAEKMDAAAKLREGLSLAREIFVPLDKPGVPVTHRIILKPNATGVYDQKRAPEENWGVGTDPQFYEGLITGLKEIGLKQFYFIESTGYDTWNLRGFNDINERLGVDIGEPQPRPRHLRDGLDAVDRLALPVAHREQPLVGLRLLERVRVLALRVLEDAARLGLLVGQVLDRGRDGVQADLPRGAPAPLAEDDLEAIVLRPDLDRHLDAVPADRLDERGEVDVGLAV